MEDIQLLELVERYVQGNLNPAELEAFEQLRSSDARTGRFITEHISFLQQLADYSERRDLETTMHEMHAHLMESGEISEMAPKTKVIDLWRKYRRVIAVAASIGGFTALAISCLVVYFTPKANTAAVEQLNRKVNILVKNQNALNNQIITERNEHKIPTDANIQSGGTSFLIDAKGYLVTNAHVINGSGHVVVQNTKGL